MNRSEFFARLSHLKAGDLRQVQIAYQLSKDAHRVQTRDGGKRYFEHPREVANVLIDRGFNDADTLTEALLHDSIEDTYLPQEVIVNTFGHRIWQGIEILSKKIPVLDPLTGEVVGRYTKPDDVYYADLDAADLQERRIKLGDRFVNIRDMQMWAKSKRLEYAKHTRVKILPLAHKTDAWFCQAIKAEVDRVLA